MGILPDYLSVPQSFGDTDIPDGLPSWLADAQRFPPLPPLMWTGGAVAPPPPPAPPSPPAQPPAGVAPPIPANPLTGIGETLGRIRAGIPQPLADNANSLLAFGGGALRGGVGQGLTDAARIGVTESELAQRRKSL